MPSQGVIAVDRALAVAATFDGALEPLTLAEISRRTALSKATILRLLASLEKGGYVLRMPDGRYQVGPAPFRLGCTYQRVHKLDDQVLPVLKDLVGKGTESASFHVRVSPESRLCVLRVDSKHSTLDRITAGNAYPLRRGAPGKVLLAFDGEAGAEFETIRNALMAHSFGERDPDCAAVAVPVFGPQQKVQGAMSLSGPRERFTRAAVQQMSKLLLEAAAQATRRLGGDPAVLARARSGARTAASAPSGRRRT
jgi:DNA-binding IclR family transcriptional regulator